jgi:acetolactate synthase-1/2/3 large subunit
VTEAGSEIGATRVVDWIFDELIRRGVRHVFMVSGGGAMYLNDALALRPELEVVCFLHEQAAAIAAEAYAKVSGNIALCLVTSGPGGTNAVTGVAGAWLDSTPMIIISGQVKRADLVGTTGVRQRGVQELDLSSIVGSITKSASMVMEPSDIRVHLDRAFDLAMGGRRGPVWIEIPLDVQAAPIDPASLAEYERSVSALPDSNEAEVAATRTAELLLTAKRPVLLVGAGVRSAGAVDQLLALVDALGVPVMTTWPAMGVVGEDHDLYVGRPGSLAGRGTNFVLQQADLLLCLGARLDMVTTGYDPKDFGRDAHKVVVDIDVNELTKLEGAVDDLVLADALEFINALLPLVKGQDALRHADWVAHSRELWKRFPIVQPEHSSLGSSVSTYHLADVLSEIIEDSDVLAPGSSGLALEVFLLALRLRTGHRATFTTGLGAMGFGPPAAIGACIASGGARTICFDGDGGFQLNIQELETIRRLDLPIKFLIAANEGYASIRASQSRWFGRLLGADATSGVTLPSLEAIAAAYQIPYVAIDPSEPLEPQLRAALSGPSPVICEVPSPSDEARIPVQTSEALPDGGLRSRAIEDLAPLLDREEYEAIRVWNPQ